MPTSDPDLLLLAPDAAMANSALPVLIYRSALPTGLFAPVFEANGWTGVWHNGVYDYDHYHSNAHEVLGVARGTARLQLGGATGQSIALVQGDCLVLPAGTGHRRISRSGDFLIIGAYPDGQENYDICRSRSTEADLRISKVSLPARDPLFGADGPLLRAWGGGRG